jgi:uncharacterized protein (TIGR03435 family)
MEELASRLPCNCVDETHLPGRYKFVLTADVRGIERPQPVSSSPDPNPEAIGAAAPAGLGERSFPDIFHALEKQLGLKLERRKVPTPVVYVDHIERVPTEN